MSHTITIGPDSYRMDVFPLPAAASTGANPQPLDIAVSADRVWLSCEFARHAFSLPLSATDGTEMTSHLVPVPSEVVFRSTISYDLPTDCTCFEDIDIDASGNVWLTQTGQSGYTGENNHFGRVLRYTPATDQWLAYPLPWNKPYPVGVLVDGTRVWTACWAGFSSLAVTRPSSWRVEQVAPTSPAWPGTNECGGWSRIDAATGAAHMAIGPDGRLYVTNYNAASVTAYDRTTLAAQTYALPAGSTKPWQITFDPFGAAWVTCDATRQLAKLNPANGVWTVYATGLATTEHTHSLAISAGVVWFTAYTLNGDAGGRIGRRTAAGVMELSEPLDTFGLAKGATGVAVSGANVWVALFGSKAVGRLTKL